LKLNDQLKSLNQQQNGIKAQRIKMQNSTNALENILRISSFEEINCQVCAIEIDERQNEITALKTKSDTLATIEQKLHILKDELTLLNNSKNNEMNVKGRIEGKLENLHHSLSVCQNTLKNTTITSNDPVFNFLSVSYSFEPKSLPQYEKESGQIVTNLNQDYKKAVNILSPLEISINKKCALTDITALPSELNKLNIACSNIFIVENKMTFLSFPDINASLVFFGAGYSVSELKEISWIKNKNIYYWGNIDAQGFEILSQLRHHFPYAKSMLMSKIIFQKYNEFVVNGTPSNINTSLLLQLDEQLLYDLIKQSGKRIEQEHMPHFELLDALKTLH